VNSQDIVSSQFHHLTKILLNVNLLMNEENKKMYKIQKHTSHRKTISCCL